MAEELKLPILDGVITPGLLTGSPIPRGATRKLLFAETERERQTFPNLPGKHLSLRKVSRGSWELVDDQIGSVSARCTHKAPTRFPHVITSQERNYEWRRVGKRQLDARSRIRDLTNATTGSAVLRRSGVHFGRKAGTQVTLAGQTELSFPVWGKGRSSALMWAIDQSGKTLIEYRYVPSKRQVHSRYIRWGRDRDQTGRCENRTH
jgi:hypothetical protein